MAPDHHAKRHDMPPCTPPAKQQRSAHRLRRASPDSTASTPAACRPRRRSPLFEAAGEKRLAVAVAIGALTRMHRADRTTASANNGQSEADPTARQKVCGRAMTRGDHITAPNCGCQSATRAAALRRRHEVMRWRIASWAVRIGSASVSTTFARPAPRGRDFAILPSQRAPHRALLPRLCWASTSPCA